jgi:hypothetical protein
MNLAPGPEFTPIELRRAAIAAEDLAPRLRWAGDEIERLRSDYRREQRARERWNITGFGLCIFPLSWAFGIVRKPTKTLVAFGPFRLVKFSKQPPWQAWRV